MKRFTSNCAGNNAFNTTLLFQRPRLRLRQLLKRLGLLRPKPCANHGTKVFTWHAVHGANLPISVANALLIIVPMIALGPASPLPVSSHDCHHPRIKPGYICPVVPCLLSINAGMGGMAKVSG